jgi:copper chaperone CopZ
LHFIKTGKNLLRRHSIAFANSLRYNRSVAACSAVLPLSRSTSMRHFILLPLLAAACVLWTAATVRAEVKVTVSKSHLCCPACFKAVDDTLKKVEGVQFASNRQDKTISITAQDEKTAQNALDALAKAGFHGKTDVESLTFKKVEVPEGTVKRMEITGIHNCCGQCTSAIKKAVSAVKGVEANTVKARETSFVVEGDFKAAELVEALLNAGFHCQVKK